MAFTNDDLKWLESKKALKSNFGFYEIRCDDGFSLYISKDNENVYHCDLIYKHDTLKAGDGKTLLEAMENALNGLLFAMEIIVKFTKIIKQIEDIK